MKNLFLILILISVCLSTFASGKPTGQVYKSLNGAKYEVFKNERGAKYIWVKGSIGYNKIFIN